MSAEKCVYTLKEIADELKVDKQKVYRFVVRNHISEVHHEVLHDVLHCDADFAKNGTKYYDETAKMRIFQEFGALSTSSTSDEVHHDVVLMQNEALHDAPEVHREAVGNESGKQDEIDFLRNQIMRMNEHMVSQNEQIRQQGEVINSLNRELEKEREHNREKDKMLMETLAKLADTQAALAVGQSAEKQKELAEALIEGHQKIDNGQTETTLLGYDEPKKHGWLRRIWNVICGK